MSLPRFHIPDAAPGARVDFPEHVAHHAREVLRLRAGVPVLVFDGAGHEFSAQLESVTRRGVTAHIGGAVSARPESPLFTLLAVSPLRGDHMELVIQKSTELGVTAIRPVVGVRTDAAARPALSGTRQERWQKVASGAAEQCGRAVVPELLPAEPLAAFLGRPAAGRRLLFLAAPDAPPLGREPRPAGVTMLIGPPGGFDPSEVAAARDAGFEVAGLGPRVLRTETAAVAALTAVQLLWGDLG